MSRFILRCLSGAACVALTQAPIPVKAEPDALTACKAAGARYVEAIGTGDPAKVAAQFTKTGLVNAPEGVFPGREAITAFDRGYVKPGISQTVTPSRADPVSAGVLCSGTFVVSFAPGFPIKQVGGNYTALIVKEGSGWQHAMLAYNYPPPQPPSQGQ